MNPTSWPTGHLDPVCRLSVITAGVTGASVTQGTVAAAFEDVWALLSDFESGFTRVQPDMRDVKVIRRAGTRVELLARSHAGMRARLVGRERPGWCWLQGRFLIVAMAARPEPSGGTTIALTGGIRVPYRSAIIPIGVRRESLRSLERIKTLLTAH